MDMDDAYANVKYIPEASTYIDRWEEDARTWREVENSVGRARFHIPYGTHPRETYDMFYPSSPPEGTVIFVHGGFWHKFDKFMWSHLAQGASERGWNVAIPSYPLAPEARISEITNSIRSAVEGIAKKTRGPLVLAGHSAGGHLVARMLCDDGVSAEVMARIQRVMSISPLSDLRPFLEMQMNDILGLDTAEVIAESPVLLPKKLDVPVTVWVGAEERPAFLDQAQWLVDAWERTNLNIEPKRHHFDVIDDLCLPESPLMNALLA